MTQTKSNISQEEFYTVTQKEFWLKWTSKLMFTLISVKLWGLIACTWVSTYLLLHHQLVEIGQNAYELGITGGQWVTFNTTIWGLIFGMKEIFRVMEKKDRNDEKIIKADNKTKHEIAQINADTLKEDNKAKKEIAKINASTVNGSAAGAQPSYTAEGKEVVGDEPN
ncbi:hypothetical protein [Sunxiuqinia indica]|uniref:hypothetical protein n=1 Tax=Sunxiuqinia indica TaxID=2692584 RepID=UPI001357AC75|nr:hypothetical protein [Sunxiuqinia indica]